MIVYMSIGVGGLLYWIEHKKKSRGKLIYVRDRSSALHSSRSAVNSGRLLYSVRTECVKVGETSKRLNRRRRKQKRPPGAHTDMMVE